MSVRHIVLLMYLCYVFLHNLYASYQIYLTLNVAKVPSRPSSDLDVRSIASQYQYVKDISPFSHSLSLLQLGIFPPITVVEINGPYGSATATLQAGR